MTTLDTRVARRAPAPVHAENGSAPDRENEPLDKPTIAELSNGTIEEMTDGELRRLIAASGHPWRSNRLDRRLAYCDRETLIRLAYLARRCCRHQGY